MNKRTLNDYEEYFKSLVGKVVFVMKGGQLVKGFAREYYESKTRIGVVVDFKLGEGTTVDSWINKEDLFGPGLNLRPVYEEKEEIDSYYLFAYNNPVIFKKDILSLIDDKTLIEESIFRGLIDAERDIEDGSYKHKRIQL